MARQPEWCDGAETYRLAGTTAAQVVTDGPALLLGVVLLTGANAARVDVYDQNSAGGLAAANRKAAVATAANAYDGDVNFPRRMTTGIVAQLSDAGAEAFIYWLPVS
jgi:hypothetical protein